MAYFSEGRRGFEPQRPEDMITFAAMDIKDKVAQLSGDLPEDAYVISDDLARLGGAEVLEAMKELLQHPDMESRYMAARTLSLMPEQEGVLEVLMTAINDPINKEQQGDFLSFLESLDISDQFVGVFKLYLNGSYKVSMIAKDLLDHQDFDITLRVLKKATKQWNHYSHNVKQDDVFELKKIEVEEMLEDLREFLEEA
ncbi:HEAT repeat domain-containing protein [Reichenbachiella ulvae]|uniref:HEAT repeat domain-containing protein n=1 Tax=Reichenbachiella ulvae TaxID=2980104 RepID=A0ABT3CS12_9BACT|nr:HEAT repeat domain-containing protein [Reichenbachiella ulvae]MCV9386496.1 HEAT repeat domain-containing protein [Reichenbachiella ulvae]